MKKIIIFLLSEQKIKNLIYKFFCVLAFLLFRNKYGRAISKMYTSFRYPHRALISGCESKYNTHIASNRLSHMEDLEIISSISRYYNTWADTVVNSPQWSTNILENGGSLDDNLRDNNHRAVLDYLQRMFSSDGMKGISMSSEFYSKEQNLFLNHNILNSVISYAEYLGIIDTECAEIGNIYFPTSQFINKTLSKIDAHHGIKIGFPEIFDAYGLMLNERLISLDMFEHLYTVEKLHEISKSSRFSTSPNVLEIGAGFGDCAYWSKTLGYAGSYAIVDLPYTAVFSSWYLMKTLGRENVDLILDENVRFSDGKITILPPQVFPKIANNQFDIVLNQNSFPEMTDQIVEGYVNLIPNILSRNGKLFTINQETQVKAHTILKQNDKLRQVSRSRSWMRAGYVDMVHEKA